MSYKAKKTFVSIIIGVLLMTAYCIYAIGKVRSGAATTDDIRYWATTILVFIGIGVVAMIVIQIIFNIVLSIAMAVKEQMQNGKCDEKVVEKNIELEMVEDEMDKMIELKSMKIGYAIVGIGFAASLVSLTLNCQAVVMLHIMFASFYIGSLVEAVAQLYFYSRGIKNY